MSGRSKAGAGDGSLVVLKHRGRDEAGRMTRCWIIYVEHPNGILKASNGVESEKMGERRVGAAEGTCGALTHR